MPLYYVIVERFMAYAVEADSPEEALDAQEAGNHSTVAHDTISRYVDLAPAEENWP